MRQSLNFIAGLLVTLSASLVFGQASTQTQSLNLGTSLDQRAQSAAMSTLSVKQVASITGTAVNNSVINTMASLPTIAAQLNSTRLADAAAKLASGKQIVEISNLGATTSILNDHKYSVTVSYDAQPIGGILTVKVALIPVYTGVGVGNRPFASRSFATAVDQLDQKQIEQIVLSLSSEISTEFASLATK